MKKIVVLLTACLFAASCTNEEIKVACIGDSITEGAGIYWQSKDSYPVQLDSILGERYRVLNAGRSGATLLKRSNLPYWICNEFSNVFAFEPDVVVIKLGTNDSKPFNWNEENYIKDLQSMVDTLNSIQTQPEIFLCLPAPAFNNAWGINDSVIRNGVIPSIEKIAKVNNLQIIDLYKPLLDHVEFFPDSIHPNEAGAVSIAELIAREIKK